MEKRSKCCCCHYWTRTRGRWKKNHLQIFSQQHSIVNGHYAFLRFPLHPSSHLFTSLFLCLRTVPISSARAVFFLKKIRQIDSYLYLMYDVCAIYSWTKTNRQPYKTILLNWWNCIVYFIHNSVHLNSIPWSNPKIRCYSDFFLCVFAAHGYNNLRKCTNDLFNIERSRKC